MRKWLKFIKKYKDAKREYQVGKEGQFEGDFAKMLVKMKYVIEIDDDGNQLIEVAKYTRKKSKTKLNKEEEKNG